MKTFSIKILTPDREVFDGEVEVLHVPTANGPYSLLANSYPFIVMAEHGLVWIQINGKQTRFALSGGILIVKKDVTVLLAETIEREDEIDVARALAAKRRAEERLAQKSADIDIKRAQAALLRSTTRLNIAGGNVSPLYKGESTVDEK